jgi:hypothetical protein
LPANCSPARAKRTWFGLIDGFNAKAIVGLRPVFFVPGTLWQTWAPVQR